MRFGAGDVAACHDESPPRPAQPPEREFHHHSRCNRQQFAEAPECDERYYCSDIWEPDPGHVESLAWNPSALLLGNSEQAIFVHVTPLFKLYITFARLNCGGEEFAVIVAAAFNTHTTRSRGGSVRTR